MSFIVKEYTVPIDARRLKKPVVFALIGDLHNFEHGPGNSELLAALYAMKPDAILCPGDMLIGNPKKPWTVACDFMTQLPLIAPVYFSNGNHESRLGKEDTAEFFARITEAGVTVLNNAWTKADIRGTDFRFFGLEIPIEKYKKFRKHRFTETEMEALIGRCPKEGVTVLLAHNPEFMGTYLEWGAGLVVSGHFHGGLIRTFRGNALMSPYGFPLPKYGYGIYNEHGSCGIVTSGLGDHIRAYRVNNPFELVRLELIPAYHGRERR